MRLPREPVVWRSAILAVVAALAQVGLLQQDAVDAVDGWTAAAIPLASLILPLLGALWARRRTLPTDTERSAPKEMVRGTDGVYRTPAENAVILEAERNDLRRDFRP